MAVVRVVAFAGREDRGHEVLDAPFDRAGRDVEAVQRRADQQASLTQVLPDRHLVLAEAGLERLDMLAGDVEHDRHGFHPVLLANAASIALRLGRRVDHVLHTGLERPR